MINGSFNLLVLGHGFEDLARDVIARDRFALGGEIGNDAVAKNGQRHCSNIFAAHVGLAVEHGALDLR